MLGAPKQSLVVLLLLLLPHALSALALTLKATAAESLCCRAALAAGS